MAGVDKVPPEEFAACFNTLIISLSSATFAICKSLKEPSFQETPKGQLGELLPWHQHPWQESGSRGQRGDEPRAPSPGPAPGSPGSRPARSQPARPPCRALRGFVPIKLDPTPGVLTRPSKLRLPGPTGPGLPRARELPAGGEAGLQDQARSLGYGRGEGGVSRGTPPETLQRPVSLQRPVGFPAPPPHSPPVNHDFLQKKRPQYVISPNCCGDDGVIEVPGRGSPQGAGPPLPLPPGQRPRARVSAACPGAGTHPGRAGPGRGSPVPAAGLPREGRALGSPADTAQLRAPGLAGLPRGSRGSRCPRSLREPAASPVWPHRAPPGPAGAAWPSSAPWGAPQGHPPPRELWVLSLL